MCSRFFFKTSLSYSGHSTRWKVVKCSLENIKCLLWRHEMLPKMRFTIRCSIQSSTLLNVWIFRFLLLLLSFYLFTILFKSISSQIDGIQSKKGHSSFVWLGILWAFSIKTVNWPIHWLLFRVHVYVSIRCAMMFAVIFLVEMCNENGVDMNRPTFRLCQIDAWQ